MPLPEAELVQCIWQGLMASVDWSARPDQIENLALREVGVSRRPTLFQVAELSHLWVHARHLLQFLNRFVTVRKPK
jgi:hypothetical protein